MTAASPTSDHEADLSTVSELYLKQCAGEPIHRLGLVQAHGFTLVVAVDSGLIVQVSAGVTRHLPGVTDVREVLGTVLSRWVHADDLARSGGLGQLSESLQSLHLQWYPLADSASAPVFECSAHRVGQHAVLECIAGQQDADMAQADGLMALQLNQALVRLRKADQLQPYFEDCVAQMQGLCGYDRVMLYRFLPDFSGEVVAEHCASGVEPRYVGLRFPASDIPPQARRLYETNTLRILADVQSAPDALLPATLPDGKALNQSQCVLRSQSPAHLVYLNNLGVRATLTISLLRNGRLWGMLACHHGQPRVPPAHLREAMREVCELMANVISMRIDNLIKRDELRWEAGISQALSDLGQTLGSADTLGKGLRGQMDGLRQAFAADAFGLRLGRTGLVESAHASSFHAQPPGQILDQVQALMADLAPGELRAFDDLLTPARRHLLPGLPQAAGLLLARLPVGEDGFCFFTRPESVTQVRWAGRPNSVTVVTQPGLVRLEARRSFEIWQQDICGCAPAWSLPEQHALQRLARLLGEMHNRLTARDLQRQLEWRARHDTLTGLLNRNSAERELVQRLQLGAQPLALLMINIDQFKRINHGHGSAGGDEVLCQVARRLSDTTRSSDQLARLGSDEFLLVTDVGQPPVEQALQIAERVRNALGLPITLGGQRIALAASVGVALHPQHGQNAATLLRHATMALHEARARGRARSVLFDDSIESTLQRADTLQDELQVAIAEHQLRLFYQPKVDLHSMKVVGLEALVRWQHPVRGLVGPLEFIDLAERCNLIGPLGRWVMEEAAAQVARWQATPEPAWPVAINVSFMQIVSGSIARDLRQCCERHQIDPCWLELELTESVMMENTQQTIAMMDEVSDLGVKVSLDDFGTGYSSLAYVRQLPLDSLKIDRSFVMNLESEQASQIVTRGIIGLASGLQLTTIAEGVETHWQLEWLQRSGCDIGQGYLFGKPVPADELPALVADIANRLGK